MPCRVCLLGATCNLWEAHTDALALFVAQDLPRLNPGNVLSSDSFSSQIQQSSQSSGREQSDPDQAISLSKSTRTPLYVDSLHPCRAQSSTVRH